MSNRPRHRSSLSPHTNVRLVTRDCKLVFDLNRTRSGVVVGRIQATGGNAHSDCWALFDDPVRFKACCDQDELRFTYPITFVQLVKEFQDVFDQPTPTDAAQGNSADPWLLG